jgi:hypothetical protein
VSGHRHVSSDAITPRGYVANLEDIPLRGIAQTGVAVGIGCTVIGPGSAAETLDAADGHHRRSRRTLLQSPIDCRGITVGAAWHLVPVPDMGLAELNRLIAVGDLLDGARVITDRLATLDGG